MPLHAFGANHVGREWPRVMAEERWSPRRLVDLRKPYNSERLHVVVSNHMRTDVGVLLPMGILVADMLPDNPGKRFFHCHVSAHLRMGMQAFHTVEGAPPANTR